MEIDPNVIATSPQFPSYLIAAGDLDAAVELTRRFASQYPASIHARLTLGYVEMLRGNDDTALEQLGLGMSLVDQQPDALMPLPESLAGLIYAFGRLGQRDEARQLFERLVAAVPDEGRLRPIEWMRAYLGIGDLNSAYEMAQKAAAEPLPSGYSPELAFAINADNDPAFERPRFIQLRRALGY